MIKTYQDYLHFMEQQKIYLKEKPMQTISPNPDIWFEDPSLGDFEELHANINGPISPKDYFQEDLHILFYLREPYIKEESWEKGDRGGHYQSTDYGKCDFDEIDNDTFENLVRFTFFIVNLLNYEKSQ